MIPDRKLKRPDGNTRKKCTVYRQRTLDDITVAMRWAMASDKRDKLDSCAPERGGYSWRGTPDIETYAMMLHDGWPEGIENAEGLEGICTDDNESLTLVRDVAGAFPNVPAHIAGSPQAMWNMSPQVAERVRGLTLVVDGSYNCRVNPETVFEYAQSVMRLVAWLSAERIECSVYVMDCTKLQGGGKYLYTIPIHLAGDVLQPERVAAILHPSFLRRGWFALIEREHYEFSLPGSSSCTSNYGHSATATMQELQQVLPDAYSVVILPKVGQGDPMKAVQESETLKLRRAD